MVSIRDVASFLGYIAIVFATDCEDLIPSCASLQSICIGSILQHHFNVINNISNQVDSSSIPALESSLPLLESDAPPVLTSNDVSSVPTTGSSFATTVAYEDALKNALPLLKESLPLIRESLPLIRESLPLIRDYLNPLDGKTECQMKATCRSCKECPKLRDSIISFVQTLCPNTCKTCANSESIDKTAAKLTMFF